MASKQKLKAEAEERGLTVGRRDGTAGEPTAADYQYALDVDSGAIEPDPPTAVEKTFEVVGEHRVLGHGPGETFDATVGPDGVIYDERGRPAAVEGPLVAAGAIREAGGNDDG